MSACEAMIVAKVARTTTGSLSASGAIRKNTLSISPGFASRKAP
ncbi:unannotated protein [freshwater metagenome]|uniref:Unannotated protein n=1 Tax=freshwater metagenome TaxID=449393 RepID=A0A6J6S3G1_9ZZZZ